MAKKNYINPRVIKAAAQVLEDYKEKNPNVALPLFEVCKTSDARTRVVFTRAAKQLHWNVVCTKGHIYENGQFIW